MNQESIYNLPDNINDDLEQLKTMCDQFAKGMISPSRFQAFRVPQGVYEQRESGTFMLRARLPAGIITPEQMRIAADVAKTYGNGSLHFTSRQDLQIHGVTIEKIHPAVVTLTNAGLSTKGGGGNTVRNIAACSFAGVCKEEVFDVTPHVVHLTETMLADPLSFQMPRKYKIAYSGCNRDCAGATINDLGFISKTQDGADGFAVYIGGGLGAQSSIGQLLEEWIPADHAPIVAEAVKRVFDQHGNRKNRHRARIRFLVQELGIDTFKQYYQQIKAELGKGIIPSASKGIGFPLRRDNVKRDPIPGLFTQWFKSNVTPQKQDGYYSVEISPDFGVIEHSQFRELAAVIEKYGDGILRATNWQNTVLRFVHADELPALHADLVSSGFGDAQPALLRRMVSCAGASTCRLGICRSRGVSSAIYEAISTSGLKLDNGIGDIAINISGCPNACGRHPSAAIGLYGAGRRHGAYLVPHYIVQLGGHIEESKTVLASGAYAIPAKNVPKFMVDLLHAAVGSGYEDFDSFVASEGRKVAEDLTQKYSHIPEYHQDSSFYYDWDSEELFSLTGRGAAECGAGVFDLITIDLASAKEAISAGKLFESTVFSAKSLLITQGEKSDTAWQSLDKFNRLFIDQGHISVTFKPLVEKALAAANDDDPETAFNIDKSEVTALHGAVSKLYDSLSPSLRL